jgi:nitrite reductase/ring-hydroxylating ferredoxin subunit
MERIVARLLRNQPPDLNPGDVEDREAIMTAARLAGSRTSYPAMSPEFRRRLAKRLHGQREGEWITRRSALVAGVGLAAGALAGVGVENRLTQSDRASAKGGARIDPRPGRWVDVAALADLPEGEGVRVSAGAVGAYLFRRGSQVRAVSSICSHLPCELSWRSEAATLICPCHNQGFTAEGESTSATYPLPALNRVQARVVAGRVEVLGT